MTGLIVLLLAVAFAAGGLFVWCGERLDQDPWQEYDAEGHLR